MSILKLKKKELSETDELRLAKGIEFENEYFKELQKVFIYFLSMKYRFYKKSLLQYQLHTLFLFKLINFESIVNFYKIQIHNMVFFHLELLILL